jgi:hypothetical protein
MEYKDKNGNVTELNSFAPYRVISDGAYRVEIYILHGTFFVLSINKTSVATVTIKTASPGVKLCLREGTVKDIEYLIINGHVKPEPVLDLGHPSVIGKTEMDWMNAIGKLIFNLKYQYAYYSDDLYDYLRTNFNRIVAAYPDDMDAQQKWHNAIDLIVAKFKGLNLHQGDLAITRQFQKFLSDAGKDYKWDATETDYNRFSGYITTFLTGLSTVYESALNMICLFDDYNTRELVKFHRFYHADLIYYIGRSVHSVRRGDKYL